MKDFDSVKYSQSFPEMKLEQCINTVITSDAKESNPTLSPSNLGCQRAAAFKLAGAVLEASEETYESGLPAAMGTFVHERIQKFLSKSSIWVSVEDFIENNPQLGLEIAPDQKHAGETSLIFKGIRNDKQVSPPFSFQCDGIVKIDNEYYVVEIKTESETAWQNRTAPNPKHELQAISYAFLYGIPNILWVYASRESFGTHRKIYLQEISGEKSAHLVAQCNKIGEAASNKDIGSLPKGKDCKYCKFTALCKGLK